MKGLTGRLREKPKSRGGKILKPTKQEIKEMQEFAKRSATSIMDAIGKKCLSNALACKDYSDENVQRYLEHFRS
ncbi:MAG TPA: hypothetical protein VFF28_03555 [Candidatus Nanoarchaeia archaeon]|nr:hypothetical protein [Candidatus Nanoarchaeia archaeon]